MLQGREPPGAEGDFTVATGSSSFCSCSPSLAHDVDEAMSTPSAMSQSLAKERDWWSADLKEKWRSCRWNRYRRRIHGS